MANVNTRETSPTVSVDDNLLRDMVDIDALQALLESFGQICGTGAGVFTPAGIRLGKPAHHHDFCSLLYASPEGKRRCKECDERHINIVKQGRDLGTYECDNGLIDFCEPIYCRVGGERCLIGVFFAGQVLLDDRITSDAICRLSKVATQCQINPDELLARFMRVPRLTRERVGEIRAWMKEFTKFIGLLVEKKAAAQQLLLDVIDSADDQSAVVRTIRKYLQPASVSIFMRRDDVPKEFADRIHLVATTSEELASRVPVEQDLDRISYRPDEGFTGWTYKTGTVLHVKDVRDESSYPQHPYPPSWRHKVKEIRDVEETQAFLAAPIRSDEGEVVGVIRAVRLKGDRDFTNDEIALLTGIAPLVGVAASKAQLYKEHSEKIQALHQAEGLLKDLTEPNATLDSITKNMVEQLGDTYVKSGNWQAVYVLQHLKSSRRFRFVAYFPSDLPDKRKGYPFPDTEGVAGHVLKTKRFYASRNCSKDGVEPTTPWTSVVCAPIFHDDQMWGAVSLCSGKELPQTEVDLASPRIDRFAQNMSLVCPLSEILDARNNLATIAAKILSLSLETHDVHKLLERAYYTMPELLDRVPEQDTKLTEFANSVSECIKESVSWAEVCLDLGLYLRLCRQDPDNAICDFRKTRLLANTGKGKTQTWKRLDLVQVAKKALASVHHLETRHNTTVQTGLPKEGYIIGDENLLYRAIRNLLENALEHGSKRVEPQRNVYIEKVPISFTISIDSEGKHATIVVRDDGVGMSNGASSAAREIYGDPRQLGRTTLEPGFGTMIVAFAFSVHNGQISLESREGTGTTVSIRLPLLENKGA